MPYPAYISTKSLSEISLILNGKILTILYIDFYQIWNINLHTFFFSFISLPSSKTMSISSFNPFSLKNQSEHSHTIRKIQEAVEYSKSQFWAIMTDLYKEINKPDDDWKIWVQTLLYHELVSYFAFQIFKILMLIHIRKSY